jgi:hypothetical protein
MIEIVQIQPSDHNFHLFENFPKEIYPADSIRFKVPETFNRQFLQACFVLINESKVCARASLYNNPYLSYQNKKTFCIGNYESVNSENISTNLFLHL